MHRALLTVLFVCTTLTAQQERWTLRGRVVADEDGRPLAGATVTLTGHQATGYPLHWAWLDWFDPEPVVTGEDGTFVFSFAPQPSRGGNDGYPSRVHLEIRAPGRATIFGQWPLSRWFGAATEELGDVAMGRGRQVRVHLRTAAGAQAAGLVVRARVRGMAPFPTPAGHVTASWAQTGPSDVAGVATFADGLPAGNVELEVMGEDAVSGERFALDTANDTPLDVELVVKGATNSVQGALVDRGGRSLGNRDLLAMFTIEKTDRTLPFRVGADGTFTIAGLPESVDAFQVRIVEDDSDRSPRWVTPFPTRSGPIRIEADPSGLLAVEVRLPDGVRAERFAVHAIPRDRSGGSRCVRTVVVAKDGQLRLDDLTVGTYDVKVHAIGARTWPSEWTECRVTGEATEPLVVVLRDPIERTLFVFTAEGRPVVDATVELVVAPMEQLGPCRSAHSAAWKVGVYDRTMTNESPRDRARFVVAADRGRTDREGRVKLRALPTTAPLTVRVRGGGAVDSLLELDGWQAGKNVLRLAAPSGGAVRGLLTGAAAEERPSTDAEAVDVETAKAAGTGEDPWERAYPAARRQKGSVVRLRLVTEGEAIERLAFWDEKGRFTIDALQPGTWDLAVVDRRRNDGGKSSDVEREGLTARIEVKAGEVTTIELPRPGTDATKR